MNTLNNYINNGSDNNRKEDPITKIRVFSHGYVGKVAFGHGLGLSNRKEENLTWTMEKLENLDDKAFQKTDSIFYSCNTGSNVGEISFAQE